MTDPARAERHEAVNELKRGLILNAARRVFEAEGLEGATMRAIAKEAGYTAGAIYFHFPSKEAIYGAVLREMLERLQTAINTAVEQTPKASQRLQRAALGFFDFFARNPRDLDFGFYLFKGGMRPRGLSPELDAELNDRLAQSLAPIGAAAEAMGADQAHARTVTAGVFGHATGLLLLEHTRRLRLYSNDPRALMETYLDRVLADLLPRGG